MAVQLLSSNLLAKLMFVYLYELIIPFSGNVLWPEKL